MTTYKEINGTNIEVLASDPSNPVEGQVWYNSTSNVVKGSAVTTAGAWVTGGALNQAREGAASTGTTKSAALFAGGRIGPAGAPPGISANTELYNGTSWTEVNNLISGRWQTTGLGSQTAALAFGGQVAPVPSGSPTVNTESWNGTSWTEVNNLTAAKSQQAGIGTQTSGLGVGGNTGSITGQTESWNGTSWTEVNDLNTARQGLGGAGIDNTSGLVFGGQDPSGAIAVTESWNGTSWTEVADLNAARRYIGGTGTQTSALGFGGRPEGPSGSLTESWNGTSWTEDGDLSNARFAMGSAGSSNTNALAFGGDTEPRAFTTATEAWTGAGAVLIQTFTDS